MKNLNKLNRETLNKLNRKTLIEKISIFTNSEGSSYQVRWFQVSALYTDSIAKEIKTKTFKDLESANIFAFKLKKNQYVLT
jgi:hypothetical protein